jgi:hypothetical protein
MYSPWEFQLSRSDADPKVPVLHAAKFDERRVFALTEPQFRRFVEGVGHPGNVRRSTERRIFQLLCKHSERLYPG